jgi:IS30 family transposase
LGTGHWEGDLIKGAGNRSSIGTLVERTNGKLVLVKLTDAKAATSRNGFVEGLLRFPAPLRLTMISGRCRRAELTVQLP